MKSADIPHLIRAGNAEFSRKTDALTTPATLYGLASPYFNSASSRGAIESWIHSTPIADQTSAGSRDLRGLSGRIPAFSALWGKYAQILGGFRETGVQALQFDAARRNQLEVALPKS